MLCFVEHCWPVHTAYSVGTPPAPSSYEPGTHLAAIDRVTSWMKRGDPGKPPIFWLSGSAYSAKSTIAQTVARLSHAKGTFVASFDLSPTTNRTPRISSLVFPAIAHQLGQTESSFGLHIAKALHPDFGNLDIAHSSLERQFEKLIIGPLLKADDITNSPLIILDGLEQCEQYDARGIIRALRKHTAELQRPLNILITSRIQPNMYGPTGNGPYVIRFHLDTLTRSAIHRYVRLIARSQLLENTQNISLPIGWPREQDIEALATTAGRDLAFITVATRFIRDPTVKNPQKQLDYMLGTGLLPNGIHSNPLDNLFLSILHNSVNNIEMFHLVVGSMLVSRDTLSTVALAWAAGISQEQVSRVLLPLQSIISVTHDVPDLIHPSFADFITDNMRCIDLKFVINIPHHEERMVTQCLDLMAVALKRNILGAPDYSLMNEEVEDLYGRVDVAFPAPLRYACCHWSSHLSQVRLGSDPVAGMLEKFVTRSLLWWIEAMGLLRSSSVTSHLVAAYQWAVCGHPESVSPY